MEHKHTTVKASKSVKTKLVMILTSLLVMTILICWFMNIVFLPWYYQYSKTSTLSESYNKVNDIVAADQNAQKSEEAGLSDHSTLSMEMLEANSAEDLYLFQVEYFFEQLYCTFDYPTYDIKDQLQMKNIKENIQSYLVAGMNGQEQIQGKELIKKSDHYAVYKMFDQRIGSYYLELFGQLDSGEYVYVRTNFQSITENAAVSNRFLAYVGAFAIVVGFFLMLLIGNRFTKPILHMTQIAQRMADLDFEAKYPVTTQDEIGMLGESINTLSEQLEETISELKSANNELQKDIEQKIQIDEMRKDFLSNVSHELKTPIALIQGYAEGLHDNINDDSESREFYCDVITDEANKMNKMVKKLLTLNQIEFGNNQISFERFDIVQVIQSVIQSASLLADQKNAVIALLDTSPVYVWADEYMVEEVVTNYISNAIHHVDGEKNIIVSLENKGDVVRIKVFNTGNRIPEEDLDKIWIKFYKVDKARTRAYGGSGIGLSIVKAIMEAMHQDCGVENKEDGVEFWFELDQRNRISTTNE